LPAHIEILKNISPNLAPMYGGFLPPSPVDVMFGVVDVHPGHPGFRKGLEKS
jgi:hypothetical protein